MAVKLSGSVSRKVPIPGLEYSSQSYSAGLEIEISSADASVVQAQLAQLYASLSQGIDAQIATTTQPPAPTSATPNRNGSATVAHQAAPVQHSFNGNGNVPSPAANQGGRNRVVAVNGSARRVNATEAQCRAIFAICKSQGLDMTAVLAEFNVADPKDLPIKSASLLIDQIKNGNAAAH